MDKLIRMAKKHRKKANLHQTPGKTKCATCKKDEQSLAFCRTRSYKRKNYIELVKHMIRKRNDAGNRFKGDGLWLKELEGE